MESKSKKFCPECGAAHKGANYCPNCGEKIKGSVDSSNQKVRIPKFDYPKDQRHSDIITTDDANGEPIVKFRNLHPNAVWLFFFQYLGKSAIVLILLFVAMFFEPLLAGIVTILYLLVISIISKLTFKHFEFEVSTVAFRKSYGIFHKYSVNIAFDQIQNINMRRSILDQMLGLAHLEIETAGTGGNVQKIIGGLLTASEGYIPGVAPDEAKDIKALMLARTRNN